MYTGRSFYQNRRLQDAEESLVMCPFCGEDKVIEHSRKTMLQKNLSLNFGGQKYWRCGSCRKRFGYPSAMMKKIGGMPYPGKRYQRLVAVDYQCGGYCLPTQLAIVRRGHTYAIGAANCGELTIVPAVHLISEAEWERLTETLFERLFIHHWKKNYVNHDVYDGEQWRIRLRFANGKVWSVYGSNAYPALWEDANGYFSHFCLGVYSWPPTPAYLQSGELFRETDIYCLFRLPVLLNLESSTQHSVV